MTISIARFNRTCATPALANSDVDGLDERSFELTWKEKRSEEKPMGFVLLRRRCVVVRRRGIVVIGDVEKSVLSRRRRRCRRWLWCCWGGGTTRTKVVTCSIAGRIGLSS